MSGRQGWRRIIRFAFTKRHAEQQVDDELRFHIESLVQRLVAEGMSEDDARHEVMERFQSYQTTRSAMQRNVERKVVATRLSLFLGGLRQDFRVGWRQYVKRPGFAVLAVLILGLGIGASTTMFTVVNGMLLDPLPYPHADRLVDISTILGTRQFTRTTAPEFKHLRERTRSLEKLAAWRRIALDVQLGDGPAQFIAAEVTRDYVDVFGVQPEIGRLFTDDDYRPDAPRVAMLSHGAWRNNWGGNQDAIGSTVSGRRRGAPEQEAFTVIGIMPRDFPSTEDLWVPIDLTGAEWDTPRWFGSMVFSSIGRLRPGASVDDVRAEAAAMSSELAPLHPNQYMDRGDGGRNLMVLPLMDSMVGGYRVSVMIFFGAAAILFAIALANLTSLLLVRALEKRHEMAIRTALGGGRGRLFRLLLAETTTLSLIGGGIGLLISHYSIRLLKVLGPADMPRLENLAANPVVAGFAVGIALLSGLVCATVSMPSATKGGIAPLIRGVQQVGGAKRSAHLRGFLITAQVALAVVLLVGSGLLTKSLIKIQSVDPGISVSGLLVMPIRLTGPQYFGGEFGNEGYSPFFRDVVQRITDIPGVASASWVPDPPIYGRNMTTTVKTEETYEDEAPQSFGFHTVGPDYFETMGIPIRRGRGITRADDEGVLPVAVVDEVFSELFWPNENPIEKRIYAWGRWFTIVGVAGRIYHGGLHRDAAPEVYVSAIQTPVAFGQQRIVIRTRAPLAALAPQLRAAVWEVDPTVPVPSIEAMDARVSEVLREPRFHVALMGSFSLAALVLTLAGIYGLMSYWVTTRTREVGLRMALGARTGQVLWAVSRTALSLVLIGLAVGLCLAAASSRLLDSILFSVSTLDPATFGMVAAGMGAIALLACLVPASRATRIDPTRSLRSD